MDLDSKPRGSTLEINLRAGVVELVSLAVLATLLAVVPTVQAQTYQVLYNFNGGADETYSWGGLTIDQSGHLYGTTIGPLGCLAGCGTVYKFSHEGSGWVFSTLYAFRGGQDGTIVYAPVTIAADGSLYGTTVGGGLIGGCSGNGCGTVFRLQPPATFCRSVTCPWNETVVYRFQECPSLHEPEDGVAFDRAGNMFGAPTWGGLGCVDDNPGDGGVFELTPSQGGWSYQTIYELPGGSDGCTPVGTVMVNQAGNVFGTSNQCGGGTVYEVSPSGSGWNGFTLHSFEETDSGSTPWAGLISDSAGNLYGTTAYGGLNDSGVVFELSPSNGSYTYSVLYNFSGGGGSLSRLSMDTAGNLYGSQYAVGANMDGLIFKLTRGSSGWTFTDLHDFNGNDGSQPVGNLALDADGNLYGSTSLGGAHGYGVIWEITP